MRRHRNKKLCEIQHVNEIPFSMSALVSLDDDELRLVSGGGGTCGELTFCGENSQTCDFLEHCGTNGTSMQ